MTFSIKNPAWHTLQQQRGKARMEVEKEIAFAVMEAAPELTWGEALREAVRIIEREPVS